MITFTDAFSSTYSIVADDSAPKYKIEPDPPDPFMFITYVTIGNLEEGGNEGYVVFNFADTTDPKDGFQSGDDVYVELKFTRCSPVSTNYIIPEP